ncbi:MAG: exopolysaccharide biosynthesis protein [Rhizobium sp.]|nr:exopolysaccharide biosynthesis protein [Rhizobium sp.]
MTHDDGLDGEHIEQKTICDQLEDLIHESHGESVTLRTLLHSLRESGFGMLMIVLVLPNCVPIPVPPGTSTIFSIPLLFLTLQLLAGRQEPWVPERLAEKEIRLSFLRAVVSRISVHLRRIERFVKPRMLFVTSPWGERLIGLCWLCFAISIAVPLPMTNFLPGIGILISGFGLLNRDGAVVLAGIAIGFVGIIATILVLTIGGHIVQGLFFG